MKKCSEEEEVFGRKNMKKKIALCRRHRQEKTPRFRLYQGHIRARDYVYPRNLDGKVSSCVGDTVIRFLAKWLHLDSANGHSILWQRIETILEINGQDRAKKGSNLQVLTSNACKSGIYSILSHGQVTAMQWLHLEHGIEISPEIRARIGPELALISGLSMDGQLRGRGDIQKRGSVMVWPLSVLQTTLGLVWLVCLATMTTSCTIPQLFLLYSYYSRHSATTNIID